MFDDKQKFDGRISFTMMKEIHPSNLLLMQVCEGGDLHRAGLGLEGTLDDGFASFYHLLASCPDVLELEVVGDDDEVGITLWS